MRMLTMVFVMMATPALAAEKPFFSLTNTDFVVVLAFILFVGILIYLKVPGLLGRLLDKRADGIRSELDEARALREEAQTLLASYERKQNEVQAQADRIIEAAAKEAKLAADAAKTELANSIERRLQAADEQIASAEASALREVRDRAVQIAIAAAGDVIAQKMSDTEASGLIDDAIGTVSAKMH